MNLPNALFDFIFFNYFNYYYYYFFFLFKIKGLLGDLWTSVLGQGSILEASELNKFYVNIPCGRCKNCYFFLKSKFNYHIFFLIFFTCIACNMKLCD